ncbi:MAG: hemin-binding protein, partial [Akkermansiaceae bacterium]|nr:hemin-binding protein [Akkermansiaceae bacterium]
GAGSHSTRPSARVLSSGRNSDAFLVKFSLRHLQILRALSATAGGLACLSGRVEAQATTVVPATQPALFIREYRVQGSTKLSALEIEEAVYPFLGPGRSVDDVEQARVALEKAFRDKGFQSVSVLIPNQDPRSGLIRFEVVEGKVGRLRVNGARYFLPSRIRGEAPSMAEGNVPDFNKVKQDILALNRNADRQVVPELKAGAEPGTIDIDLNVKDQFPLHGSLELNNRYSANTTEPRLNGALSYGNLFQLGHTIGMGFQVAPERADDALVFNGFYQARVSDSLSLMLQGTKQDSDISTLGGSANVGKGYSFGLRALYDLPTRPGFNQTFSLGLDYKYSNDRSIAGSSPVEYLPISANYGASWTTEKTFTELNGSLNFHLRGLGSDSQEFDSKRYGADGSYIYLRGDASHTRDLANGSQLFGKIQGQVSNEPLVNTEQFSGGGLGSARGYLEATALGDNGLFATAEFRSPSFIGKKDDQGKQADEWRIHAFVDGGTVTVLKPLPAQHSYFNFLSAGAGTRFRFRNHYNGSLDLAVPFTTQDHADAGDIRITFRGWTEF